MPVFGKKTSKPDLTKKGSIDARMKAKVNEREEAAAMKAREATADAMQETAAALVMQRATRAHNNASMTAAEAKAKKDEEDRLAELRDFGGLDIQRVRRDSIARANAEANMASELADLQSLNLKETRRKSVAIETRRRSMAAGGGGGLVIDQSLLLGAEVEDHHLAPPEVEIECQDHLDSDPFTDAGVALAKLGKSMASMGGLLPPKEEPSAPPEESPATEAGAGDWEIKLKLRSGVLSPEEVTAKLDVQPTEPGGVVGELSNMLTRTASSWFGCVAKRPAPAA